MTTRTFGLMTLGLSSAALLGGCMTTSPPRLAYFRVPCDTPGAVVATPIALEPGQGTGNAGGAASSAVPAASAKTDSPATCVVAVADASSGYRGSYYSGRGYYGRPYFGSVGFGFGFGSHGGGHRNSGGHHPSGHGSRHH
jgi:hypothetical protein